MAGVAVTGRQFTARRVGVRRAWFYGGVGARLGVKTAGVRDAELWCAAYHGLPFVDASFIE